MKHRNKFVLHLSQIFYMYPESVTYLTKRPILLNFCVIFLLTHLLQFVNVYKLIFLLPYLQYIIRITFNKHQQRYYMQIKFDDYNTIIFRKMCGKSFVRIKLVFHIYSQLEISYICVTKNWNSPMYHLY